MADAVVVALDGSDELVFDKQVRPKRQWGAPVVLAVIPVVVLVVLRVSPYFRLNNGDPFIYVGYSNDFRGHVARFGYTYHAVRWGLIFPLRASLVFGPVWGYFILRYVLYLVAIIPIYFALRPMGRRIGLLGAVLFVANPVTAEAILSTYVDTVIVPLFTATVCLLAIAVRHRGRAMIALAFAAGTAAGIAVNANIFFGALLALSVAAPVAALAFQRRFRDALRIGIPYTLGVAAVCLAGVLVYSRMFGEWNIYETTIQAAKDVKNDPFFNSSYLGWLRTRRYAYAVPIALAFGIACLIRGWRTSHAYRLQQTVIIGVAAGALAYFLFYQFVLGGQSIAISYYFSYVIGPTCLLVAAGVGWAGGLSRVPTWLMLGTPVAFAYASQTFEIRSISVYAVVTVALIAVIARLGPVSASVAALAAMSVAWGAAPRQVSYPANVGYQYEPHYEDAFGDSDDTGFEAYLLASKLPFVVPNDPNRVAPMLFWYPTFDAMLDSVQASYHWQTSTVQRIPDAGMPEITPDDMSRLNTLVGGYVVLLARTEPEIQAGLQSLRTAGFTLGDEPPARFLRADDSSMFALPIGIVAAPSGP